MLSSIINECAKFSLNSTEFSFTRVMRSFDLTNDGILPFFWDDELLSLIDWREEFGLRATSSIGAIDSAVNWTLAGSIAPISPRHDPNLYVIDEIKNITKNIQRV